jgi:hypothetical protein
MIVAYVTDYKTGQVAGINGSTNVPSHVSAVEKAMGSMAGFFLLRLISIRCCPDDQQC